MTYHYLRTVSRDIARNGHTFAMGDKFKKGQYSCLETIHERERVGLRECWRKRSVQYLMRRTRRRSTDIDSIFAQDLLDHGSNVVFLCGEGGSVLGLELQPDLFLCDLGKIRLGNDWEMKTSVATQSADSSVRTHVCEHQPRFWHQQARRRCLHASDCQFPCSSVWHDRNELEASMRFASRRNSSRLRCCTELHTRAQACRTLMEVRRTSRRAAQPFRKAESWTA